MDSKHKTTFDAYDIGKNVNIIVIVVNTHFVNHARDKN